MNKYLNILFLVILLSAVFLAKQPFTQNVWPYIYKNIINPFFEKITNIWNTAIMKEVEKRKGIVEEKIAGQPKEISNNFSQVIEGISKNIKNFIFNQIKNYLNK